VSKGFDQISVGIEHIDDIIKPMSVVRKAYTVSANSIGLNGTGWFKRKIVNGHLL
jgi:hypothetical protein